MKRLFLLMVILMAGAVSQVLAGELDFMDADKDGKVSQEEYLQSKKSNLEKQGKEYNEETFKSQFAKRDLDKDGFLSAEEQAPAPKKEK